MRKQISNYRGELPRQEFLKQAVLAIEDDLSRPWSDYPCLHWPYAHSSKGSGVVTINNKAEDVSRQAFVIANGGVPELHSIERYCRSKDCYRPIHLFADPDRLYFLERTLQMIKYDLSIPWYSYHCLEWPYVRHQQNRYGLISFGGKWARVSRLSYEKTRSVSLGKLNALHHCDNPPCFHPAHIFAGTQADNTRDMIAKGRYRNGPNQVQRIDPRWFSKWTVLRQQPEPSLLPYSRIPTLP